MVGDLLQFVILVEKSDIAEYFSLPVTQSRIAGTVSIGDINAASSHRACCKYY